MKEGNKLTLEGSFIKRNKFIKSRIGEVPIEISAGIINNNLIGVDFAYRASVLQVTVEMSNICVIVPSIALEPILLTNRIGSRCRLLMMLAFKASSPAIDYCSLKFD